MVVDSIDNVERYTGLAPRIRTALEFLKSRDFTSLEPGRIDIEGDDIYALIQKYDTRTIDACKWESHRRYIDVQFVASGRELIGWAVRDLMEEKLPYNETKDQLVHQGDGAFLMLPAGYFAVLWPEDAHMPCLAVESPEPVIKVVVKVLL